MNKFSYTFIIPHHNSPELLNRCLESIPAREDIQIIVVDDNSREDAKPCITRSDVEVIYIDAAHTKGAGRARNIGLKSAKGKWVLFTDCDDYYSGHFLSTLDQYKEQDIDVLYFNYTFIDGGSGNQISDVKLQELLCKESLSSADIGYIRYRNNPPWSKMVKREYIARHRMYFEEVPNGNDVLFSLFVASYTDHIAICGKRLYNYIKTPNSIGTKKQSANNLQCRIYHRIKMNIYFNSIGHPEWKLSIFRFLCSTMKRYDIKTFMQVLLAALKLSCNKKQKVEWVQLLENHKKEIPILVANL